MQTTPHLCILLGFRRFNKRCRNFNVYSIMVAISSTKNINTTGKKSQVKIWKNLITFICGEQNDS